MILLHTLTPEDELKLTRQALEKEQLHSPSVTSRVEQGPRGEADVQLGEVSWRPGEHRWPKRDLLSRSLSHSFGKWACEAQTFQMGPFVLSLFPV